MTSASSATSALLTIPETAVRLRVTRATVYRLINGGALRAVDISVTGRARMRVREDDLAAFIDARTANPHAPSVEDALAASS